MATSKLLAAARCCFSNVSDYGETTTNISTVASRCQDLTDEVLLLCTDSQSRSRSLTENSRQYQSTMRSMDASLLDTIQNLIGNQKSQETIQICRQVEESAKQITEKAHAMGEALQTTINNLPEHLKEAHEEEQQQQQSGPATASTAQQQQQQQRGVPDATAGGAGADAEHAELLQLMDKVDVDVAELDNTCSQSRGSGFNLFSAATVGSNIFEQVSNKGATTEQIFGQMQTVSQSLKALVQTLLLHTDAKNATCCSYCDQMKAIFQSIGALFQCQKFATLLARAAEAAMRLIQAIGKLIGSALEKVQGFVQEFFAAKKIGKFVQSSMAVATGLVSNFRPPSSSGTSRS
jgi:hypothetical protein